MSVEDEQIRAEIEEIFDAHFSGNLGDAKQMRFAWVTGCKMSLFRQYRGYALYSGFGLGFPLKWDKEEDPPPHLYVKVGRVPNEGADIVKQL